MVAQALLLVCSFMMKLNKYVLPPLTLSFSNFFSFSTASSLRCFW
jgi:hypothetical protein